VSARGLAVFAFAAAACAAAPAHAGSPVCVFPEKLISWPAASPVWEMCMLTPMSSSGGNGSGIELRNVYYNGHLVFKRAHAPVLNVNYDQGGCGCFRDWSDEEWKFRVRDAGGNVVDMLGAGNYIETSFPAETVCESGGSGGDIPSTAGFTGVAAETSGDPLVLTTQMAAGWYRYVMRWKFYMDGRVQPWFGYAAVFSGCISSAHTHHNYWRLDFDIDGAKNDTIQKGSPLGLPGRPDMQEMVGAEQSQLIKPSYNWSVSDLVSKRGYRVVPGPAVAADSFAVSDSWALRYNPSEINDQGGSCATSLNGYLSNERTNNEDVVLWVRGGQFHQANDLDDCGTSVYTLEPFGNWAP
jgi:hypothetical protein